MVLSDICKDPSLSFEDQLSFVPLQQCVKSFVF